MGAVEVGAPDVAAVDQAERQQHRRREQVEDPVELVRRSHEVEVQALAARLEREREVVAERTEVGGEQELRARVAPREARQRAPVRSFSGVVEIGDEARFVELHPAHAALVEQREELLVDGEQGAQRVERPLVRQPRPARASQSSRNVTGPRMTGRGSTPSERASSISSSSFRASSSKR